LKKHLNIVSKEEKRKLEKESIDSEIYDIEKGLDILTLDFNTVKHKLTKDLNATSNEQLEIAINNKFNKYFEEYLIKAKDYSLRIKSLKIRRGEYTKKVSSASIIMNSKGEILLLERTKNDDFHPNTWCLPGGAIEFGSEGILEGATRELQEETGLSKIELLFQKEYNLKNIDLFYFIGYLNDTYSNEYQEIFLDYNEHNNYIWASPKMWNQMDLILDLKEHLNEILNKNIASYDENIGVEDSFNLIKKAYKEDKISEDIFNKAMISYFTKTKTSDEK